MKVWSWVASAAALVAVGAVAGFGVAAHEQLGQLEHAPAFAMPTPTPVVEPAAGAPVDTAALADALSAKAGNPALADFHARVTNALTGQEVFDQLADQPLRPASTTKVLTAAAAALELGPHDVITTPVYRGANPGEAVIKASGDVWMNHASVDKLAAQLAGQGITQVLIDTSLWEGMPELPDGWHAEDIDGGYVAPLQPAALSAGRGLDTETGDVPRSHTPALDVAQALADAIGAGPAAPGTVPAGAEQIAAVDSSDLTDRLAATMKDSDNVYAEAIGREVALRRGTRDAPAATLSVLAEHGFDTAGCTIHDNSGLSELNLITPKLLDAIFARAAAPAGTDAAAASGDTAGDAARLRPLLAAVPIASADGTLAARYGDLPGRGWVRAKTGTLDKTSGLAGTVTSEHGNVYSFAFLSNGSDILEARRAMDEMASVLREY